MAGLELENKIRIIDIIKESKFYYYVISIFLAFGFVLITVQGYKGSFLFLNQFNSNYFDIPMLILTYAGDSAILASLIILAFRTNKLSLILIIISSIILTGLFAQFLKINFFPNWDRPPKVFNISSIHLVPPYILNHHSFPSGHATSFGSVFTILAFNFKGKIKQQVILGLAMILLSFTRIYLGVHFLGDVLVGNLIGIVGSILLLKYLYPGITKFFDIKKGIGKKLYFSLKLIAIMSLFGSIYINYKLLFH